MVMIAMIIVCLETNPQLGIPCESGMGQVEGIYLTLRWRGALSYHLVMQIIRQHE